MGSLVNILTGEAEDIEMPKVQETKKKPVARARRPSISDTLKAGRTQGTNPRKTRKVMFILVPVH